MLGGFLYVVGPSLAYAIAAMLQLVSAVPLLLIRYHREPTRSTDRPTLSSALQGLKFVRRSPIVLAAISLDLFAVLFGGAVALIPVVASERLGVGDMNVGERCSMVMCSTSGAMDGTSVTAVAPEPITTTFLPL